MGMKRELLRLNSILLAFSILLLTVFSGQDIAKQIPVYEQVSFVTHNSGIDSTETRRIVTSGLKSRSEEAVVSNNGTLRVFSDTIRKSARKAAGYSANIIRLLENGLVVTAIIFAITLTILYLEMYAGKIAQRERIISYIHDQDGQK